MTLSVSVSSYDLTSLPFILFGRDSADLDKVQVFLGASPAASNQLLLSVTESATVAGRDGWRFAHLVKFVAYGAAIAEQVIFRTPVKEGLDTHPEAHFSVSP